jgi:hypothetical protein
LTDASTLDGTDPVRELPSRYNALT